METGNLLFPDTLLIVGEGRRRSRLATPGRAVFAPGDDRDLNDPRGVFDAARTISRLDEPRRYSTTMIAANHRQFLHT